MNQNINCRNILESKEIFVLLQRDHNSQPKPYEFLNSFYFLGKWSLSLSIYTDECCGLKLEDLVLLPVP